MKKSSDNITLREAFKDFLISKSAKGIKDKTITTYNYHFTSISKRLDVDMTFGELSKRDLEKAVVSMRSEGLSQNSISTYVRILNIFLRWCAGEGYTNITLPKVKEVETVKETYTDEELDLLLRYKSALEQGKSARVVELENEEEVSISKQFFLLTTKPVLYVCNVDDSSAVNGNAYVDRVREAIKDEEAELIIISAQTEADIAELESYEEKQMFLEDMGLQESGCDRLIKAIYKLLNLETFITAGPMEVKAWTYRRGWKAPQCAGVIHTDFEKGFIRAEVIKYDDYIKYGSEAAVREAGKMGVEGKDYVVQDGDIMHFRFNV